MIDLQIIFSINPLTDASVKLLKWVRNNFSTRQTQWHLHNAGFVLQKSKPQNYEKHNY